MLFHCWCCAPNETLAVMRSAFFHPALILSFLNTCPLLSSRNFSISSHLRFCIRSNRSSLCFIILSSTLIFQYFVSLSIRISVLLKSVLFANSQYKIRLEFRSVISVMLSNLKFDSLFKMSLEDLY